MKQTTQRRPAGRQAARFAGASVSALAAMSMLAPMAFAQGVGGGGIGGGGGGGGPATDMLLYTVDDANLVGPGTPNAPTQGWGQDSINYFLNLPYNDTRLNFTSSSYRTDMPAACSTAIANAIARNPASTQARVVQVGIAVRQNDPGGSTWGVAGAVTAEFNSWYETYWPAASSYLLNWPTTRTSPTQVIIQDVHDEFLRQSSQFATNVRIVCVAMNDMEPSQQDFSLNVSTDKGTTFTQAGATNAVDDVIHASGGSATTTPSVNATVTLTWDGVQGNPKSVNKPVTMSTMGDTRTPSFAPSDFGWTEWPAGQFWFDVDVPKQGQMAAAVNTADRDPRETWQAAPKQPSKTLSEQGATTPIASNLVLGAQQNYDARITATANGYTSMRIIDTVLTDKAFIGSETADVPAAVKVYGPNGQLIPGTTAKIDRSQAGKIIVSVDITGMVLQGDYTMVVPTFSQPTTTDYTITDNPGACYGAAFATCYTGSNKSINKVTGEVNKVWVLNSAGALVANDPNWTNSVGADNMTFLPGSPVSAVVNGTIPANLVEDLNSYSIVDDWTAAAKYVDFTDVSKHKVFWNGTDVTAQFTITNTGTKVTAVAKAGSAFLASTGKMPNDGVVKLVLTGVFKTDYDTGGVLTKLTNAGSQTSNNETLNSNVPAVYTITPKPNKAWVLDQTGALTTVDPGWTNNVGADEKVFAPGAAVSAVVNGSVPANLSADMTAYKLVDDWTNGAKYVDFTDATKHKVFFNGTDVTGEFTVVNAGTVVTATAKPAFLARTGGLASAASVKLVLNGAFRMDYDTGGLTVKLTNSGAETWNSSAENTNVPAVYTVTPNPNKVWVLNTAGALITQDANETNTAGVDNKVFAPGTPITAVVNGKVPANLASDLSQYSLTDDWSNGAKFVDFPNASARVYLDGVDVTAQFTITTSNGVTKAEAKAAFLGNTAGRTSDGIVKLVLNGNFRMDYVTDSTPDKLTNTGNESWNNKVIQSNSPSVYTVTPTPNKAWTLDQAGALVTVDTNWTNKVGADGFTFLPGTPITAVVNGSVPKNLGVALASYTLTDNWTNTAPYIDFSDPSKAKVFLDGVDVTTQFDITVNNTMTVAKAKPEFLAATLNRATDGVVKLVINGSFRTDYDTAGQVEKMVNAGSEAWNGKIMPTNTPPVFTQTPKPNKVWVLDEAGALNTADANWTNTAGSDERLFAPGTPVTAVVNGKIPANLALDMTAYRLVDDWSASKTYVDFSDASKVKVFLDGFDVTADFTVTVDAAKGITTAIAKPSFLANTGLRKTEGVVKLVLNGAFRSDYSTDGQVVKMTNAGSELWNGMDKPSNVPAVYTATPKPDKAWVLDAAGALVTADPNWTNNVGADNKVFLPADGVAAVVDGKIPANLATALTNYVITDDWTAASKYVDFTDPAKAKVYLDGKDVTAQFDIKVDGTKTIATAKAEFLAKTALLPKDAVVKLVLSGNLRSDYDTNGQLVRFTNAGFETWNTRTEPSNVPAIFTWTPDPHKQVLASAYQGGDQSDINGLQVFPGQKIEYAVQVDLRIPDNLAWGTNAVKSLSVEDSYDPMFTPDKPSVEFWDARTQKVIPRTVYKLTWNDANHSFIADFDADWVKANVTPDAKGWLILRFDGSIKKEAPDGSVVKNQAFQILNGVKIGTEIPEVKIPSWMPHKEDLNTNLANIDGKTVLKGDVLLYRLTLDGGPARTDLAYDVHKLGIVDDYDEGYLDVDASKIQILDKADGKDVTAKFNVVVKDGKLYVFAKTVDSTNVNGDLVKGDPQPADLAAYDAKSIDPINDPVIDQSLLGKKFWVIMPTTVNKEVDGYVIKNQARQNLENTWKDTEIVSNPLKKIDPTKDVVVDESTKDKSINGTEIKLDTLFNYRLNSSVIPPNRAYDASQWSVKDTFDGAHDRYTGQWAIYANADVYNGDTIVFKKGDLLADYAHHESETYKGLFVVTWDAKTNTMVATATDKLFALVNSRNDLPAAWSLYVQMERVAPGDAIQNVYTETYNKVDRPSNVVETKTFEHPSIAVVKYTLADGPDKGDRDFADQPHLISLADQIKAASDPNGFGVKVGFTVTNTGDVDLKEVALSDATAEGTTGTVSDVQCTVPVSAQAQAALNAGSTAAAPTTMVVTGDKIASLAKGQTVNCVGTLTSMKPGELHTDTATAKGKSVFTGKEVTSTDPWNAATAPEKPSISVVKFTASEGVEKGDRDNPADPYLVTIGDQVAAALAGKPVSTKVDFTVANTGDVPLVDVKLSDVVDAKTKGAMENLSCTVADPADATKTVKVAGDKIASLKVGEKVDCTADMTGLKPEEIHRDDATVTGKSLLSGKEVTATDPWNAKAEKETPFIDVVKFTLDEGIEKGDRNDPKSPFVIAIEKQVAAFGGTDKSLTKVAFQVTNSGDVPLKDVKLTDLTDSKTKGSVTNIVGVIKGADGKDVEIKGDTIGTLAVGQSVVLVGDLVDMLPSEIHTDTATAEGTSILTGTKVTDSDPWNANAAPEKPVIDVEKFTLSEDLDKGDRDSAEAAYQLGAKTQSTGTGTPNGSPEEPSNTGAPVAAQVKVVNGIEITVTPFAATATTEGGFTVSTKVAADAAKKPADGKYDLVVYGYGTPAGNGASEFHLSQAKPSVKVTWSEANHSTANPATEVKLSMQPVWVGNPAEPKWEPVVKASDAAAVTPAATPTTAGAANTAVWTAKDTVQVGYRITNKGNVPLKDVVLTDAIVKGSGTVTDLKCTIKGTDGKPTEVSGDKVANLAVGESVDCTAVVSGILPEELHQNTAKVTGKSALTGAEVTDSDDWFAKAPGHPSIKVEKFTLSEGLPAGDRNTKEEALDLKFADATAKAGTQIGFKVTNTGDTFLKDVQLSDKTIVGPGKISSLACTVPAAPAASAQPTSTATATSTASSTASPSASASPSSTASPSTTASPSSTATPSNTATTSTSATASPSATASSSSTATQTVTGDKIGELAPGQSVSCVGTLAMSIDQVKEAGKVVMHSDTATATGASKIDGVKVSDTDDWNAKTTVPAAPVTQEPNEPKEPKGTQTGDQLFGNNPGGIAGGIAAILAALGLGGGWVARNRRRSTAAVAGTSSDDQE